MWMFPNNQKSIITFILSIAFNGFYFFRGNGVTMNDVMTQRNGHERKECKWWFSISVDEDYMKG